MKDNSGLLKLTFAFALLCQCYNSQSFFLSNHGEKVICCKITYNVPVDITKTPCTKGLVIQPFNSDFEPKSMILTFIFLSSTSYENIDFNNPLISMVQLGTFTEEITETKMYIIQAYFPSSYSNGLANPFLITISKSNKVIFLLKATIEYFRCDFSCINCSTFDSCTLCLASEFYSEIKGCQTRSSDDKPTLIFRDDSLCNAMGELEYLSFSLGKYSYDYCKVRDNPSNQSKIVYSLNTAKPGLFKPEISWKFNDYKVSEISSIQTNKLPDNPYFEIKSYVLNAEDYNFFNSTFGILIQLVLIPTSYFEHYRKWQLTVEFDILSEDLLSVKKKTIRFSESTTSILSIFLFESTISNFCQYIGLGIYSCKLKYTISSNASNLTLLFSYTTERYLNIKSNVTLATLDLDNVLIKTSEELSFITAFPQNCSITKNIVNSTYKVTGIIKGFNLSNATINAFTKLYNQSVPLNIEIRKVALNFKVINEIEISYDFTLDEYLRFENVNEDADEIRLIVCQENPSRILESTEDVIQINESSFTELTIDLEDVKRYRSINKALNE